MYVWGITHELVSSSA